MLIHLATLILFTRCVQVDRALADIILKLLCWEPSKRLSTIDALLHPFFDALSPVRHLLQVCELGRCVSMLLQSNRGSH